MLIGLLLLAQAGPSAAFDSCMRRAGGVSTVMLDCGHAEIARWDARLNSAYRALLARSSAAGRDALRARQRAWLAHHLSETRRLAADPASGSAAFLGSQQFELSDLAARTRVLETELSARERKTG